MEASKTARFGGGVGVLRACFNLGDEPTGGFIERARLVRVALEPGEGLILPESGMRWRRCPLDGVEFDVMLLIGQLACA